MINAWSTISIYMLALIGFLALLVVSLTIYLVQKYDISFTITTAKDREAIKKKKAKEITPAEKDKDG